MSKMKNMRTALLFLLVAMISLSVSAQNVTVKRYCEKTRREKPLSVPL